MAKTLYKLTDDYKVLENMLDREEYDFDQEGIKQALNSLKVDIEDKVENVAKFVLSLQAQAEMIKTEEARLRARRNALENRAECPEDIATCEYRKEKIDSGYFVHRGK